MDRKDLDELLEKNFSNVNSWLNFAEAKNAAREHIDNQEITVSKNIKEQEDVQPVRGRGRR